MKQRRVFQSIIQLSQESFPKGLPSLLYGFVQIEMRKSWAQIVSNHGSVFSR